MDDVDHRVRLQAFEFLEQQSQLSGDVLPKNVLADGFDFGGHRVRLLGPQGIFKPAILTTPISITTVPVVEGRERPYEDEVDAGGFLLYRYRGTDPNHPATPAHLD